MTAPPRTPEIYKLQTRSLEDEVRLALDWMRLEGHERDDVTGDCKSDCVKCGPYRTTPEVEHSIIVELLRFALTHPPRARFETTIHVHRTRLQLLARHPDVSLVKRLPLDAQALTEVVVETAYRGRLGRAVVRGLPLLHHQEQQVLSARQRAAEALLDAPLPEPDPDEEPEP